MSKVIVDDELRAKLNGLDDAIEVCEPSGETVGRFVPEEQYLKLIYAWEKATMGIEELDRRAAEPGGMTLTDFWKTMGFGTPASGVA
jgi:hypothetical protein